MQPGQSSSKLEPKMRSLSDQELNVPCIIVTPPGMQQADSLEAEPTKGLTDYTVAAAKKVGSSAYYVASTVGAILGRTANRTIVPMAQNAAEGYLYQTALTYFPQAEKVVQNAIRVLLAKGLTVEYVASGLVRADALVVDSAGAAVSNTPVVLVGILSCIFPYNPAVQGLHLAVNSGLTKGTLRLLGSGAAKGALMYSGGGLRAILLGVLPVLIQNNVIFPKVRQLMMDHAARPALNKLLAAFGQQPITDTEVSVLEAKLKLLEEGKELDASELEKLTEVAQAEVKQAYEALEYDWVMVDAEDDASSKTGA